MKLFKINFLILFFISNFLTNVNAGTGPASVYKVQIYKIELCDNTSTATECEGPVTIYDGGTAGSGDIDIASTTAGAAAASLGNLNKAAIGTEYTYMQVTMDRAFKVSGYASPDNGADICYTNANGANNSAATGSATASDQTEVTLYAAFKNSNLSDKLSGMDSLTDATPTDKTIANGDTHFQWRMKLTNSLFLKGGRIPTVKIAFGTANAVGATGNMDGGGDGCDANDESIGMYADAPDTSVTFE